MICEYDEVVLLKDVEDLKLTAGSIGIALDRLGDGEAFMVEFYDPVTARTLAVEAVDASLLAKMTTVSSKPSE